MMKKPIPRRMFLRGAAGVLVGLPLLESLGTGQLPLLEAFGPKKAPA